MSSSFWFRVDVSVKESGFPWHLRPDQAGMLGSSSYEMLRNDQSFPADRFEKGLCRQSERA
jgi:hypothetical protein